MRIKMTRFIAIVRALKERNYRLFFMGQSVSLIGTWMQQVAVMWLVYRLTKSTFWLGVVGFTSQIPAFILTPFAGVLADRFDRYRMLVAAQTLSMVQAILLTLLFFSGAINIWYILGLSALLGTIGAFEMPARHAFVVDLVENHKDLHNAIALNSSMFNLGRLLGPFFAGIIIAAWGEGICFLINAVSYIGIIAALLSLKVRAREHKKHTSHIFTHFKEGISYALNSTPIRYILIISSLASLIGSPYVVLVPVYAAEVLKRGSEGYGFLISVSGLGALTGALYLASRKSVLGLVRVMGASSILFGLGILAFSLSKSFPLSAVIMFVLGFGAMVQMASMNTILQTIVDDDKRGRVMSLYITAFIGMMPLGSILVGSIADKVGAVPTLIACGLLCLIVAIWFAAMLPKLREAIRPLYRQKGILPLEVAAESIENNR